MRWSAAVATLGPVGYCPAGPGTLAALVAASLLYLAARPVPSAEAAGRLDAVLVLLSFLAVPVCGRAEKHLGRIDDNRIVLDEFTGMIWSAAFLPKTIPVLWISFFLFRLLDILKPPPVRSLARRPGGWGIVLDDFAAAVYANLLTRFSLFLWPRFF